MPKKGVNKMKSFVAIICSIMICGTALFIFISNKENDRYYYSVVPSGLIVKIDKYTGDILAFNEQSKVWSKLSK
jgi:hypothetical protein